MSDGGPSFVAPTVGRIVHYFPRDERLDIPPASTVAAQCWAAIVTFVHERERDERGDEIGPCIVSLTAFPPSSQIPRDANARTPTARVLAMSPFEAAVDVANVPLSGMYDRDELDKHPEWVGCWNWPPRIVG